MKKIFSILLMIYCLPQLLTADGKLTLVKPADTDQSPAADSGKVFYSNGEELTGSFSMTKTRQLKINTEDGMKMLSFDQIREIRFFPEKQEMEQKWMFPEAGKVRKEKYGDPYPVQYLKARIMLKNGQQLSGHLFASVLYLQPGNGKKKPVLLMSKQRGKEGGTFADLVYPEQIIISAADPADQGEKTLLEFPENYLYPEYEIAALSIPDLLEAPVTKGKSGPEVNGEFPAGLFVAIKKENEITAFLSGDDDPELFTRVKDSVAEMKDFFDRRELKAVCRPDKGTTVYSLTLMVRQGKTSLGAEKSNPWRLIIQRWKYDPADGKLLLSAKGWLFRGIDKRGASGPEIKISKEPCKLKKME